MKIRLNKDRKGDWVAMPEDMPGMPPCGSGVSKRQAMLSLFMHLIHEHLTTRSKWLDFVDWTKPIEIIED